MLWKQRFLYYFDALDLPFLELGRDGFTAFAMTREFFLR